MANDTRLRPRRLRLHPRHRRARIRVFERLRFGIVGINDINPTVRRRALRRHEGPAASAARAAHEGIDEYLDTKLVGISI